MKRLLRLGVLLLLLLELSAVLVQAVSFGAQCSGACRPGKTVAVTVSVETPGDTAAFLVTAESDAFAFVRADASSAAKTDYTRAYGAGGSGSFVYTAKSGACFSGEAVTFVFRAPETPGSYTITVTVSQVANTAGEMTDTVYTETLTVAVEAKAPDTPAAETYASMPEESSREEVSSGPGGEEVSSNVSEAPAASMAATTAPTPQPLEALPAKEQNSFLLGMGAAAMVFALGIGFYTLLARQKEPPKDE